MTGRHTISRLAKQFGLSRSTLLHYDRIGLLSPIHRSAAGYRIYSSADVARLEQICRFRTMGIPLAEIGKLLTHPERSIDEVLRSRAQTLKEEIVRLQNQLAVIHQVLQVTTAGEPRSPLNKQSWSALLAAAGLDEAGQWQWHREFEVLFPDAHQSFLEEIGIPPEEIARIRSRSQLQD